MSPARRWRRGPSAVAEFFRTEASGGVVLLVATAPALILANTIDYEAFWHRELRIGPLAMDLRHWTNDGLMSIFFFVVGLEIKRELVEGELHEVRVATVPIAAALGGMVAPALVYLSRMRAGPIRVGGRSRWRPTSPSSSVRSRSSVTASHLV